MIQNIAVSVASQRSPDSYSSAIMQLQNAITCFKFYLWSLPPQNHLFNLLLTYHIRHMFVKHGHPQWQQSQNMAKISKSYILTPPTPWGHVMSEKCEEPIDELTVQVWLLYHPPNFKYCTPFASGTELWTDGQTNGQTNRQIDRRSDYSMPPADLSGRGHKKFSIIRKTETHAE